MRDDTAAKTVLKLNEMYMTVHAVTKENGNVLEITIVDRTNINKAKCLISYPDLLESGIGIKEHSAYISGMMMRMAKDLVEKRGKKVE